MTNNTLTKKIGALFTGGAMLATSLFSPQEVDARTRIMLDFRRGRAEVSENNRNHRYRVVLDGRNNQVQGSYNDRNTNVRIRKDLNESREHTNPSSIVNLIKNTMQDLDQLYNVRSNNVIRVQRQGHDAFVVGKYRIGHSLNEFSLKLPYGNQVENSKVNSIIDGIKSTYQSQFAESSKP